jgi:hypothetical protein
MRNTTLTVVTVATLFFGFPAAARSAAGDVEVVVSGSPAPLYFHQGTRYVEARRGREYTLRLTNPLNVRVAVALSVDGLNTIDARHTDALSASKWVLGPYETVEIEGWQVSDRTARRFVFTGERNSYGAALGQTENLGVIEAIFYRERRRPIARHEPWEEKHSAGRDSARHTPPPSAAAGTESQGALSDDYAATGMGDRTRHDVREVSLDLDPHPFSSVRIRYEFRPQLVKLGVLPSGRAPLERRERARGFEGYCPEP